MKKIYNYILPVVFLFAATACEDDAVLEDWLETNPIVVTEVTGSAGDADLSNLVVLGTSLGSGFMDGALYDVGQASSFPALIATQLQISGIGGTTDFGQPDINSSNGYNFLLNDGTSGRTELSLSLLVPVPTTGDLVSILTPWGGTTSELNNFSVPVTQAAQLAIAATGGPRTDTYGGVVPAAVNPAFNPFYERFASSPSPDGATGSSPLTDALSAQGTFFIYEAGVNDVGLYAAGGGTTAIGPLTGSATYEASADAAIHTLATAGTFGTSAQAYSVEGVVLNVPPVLVFPFFQAVSYDAIELTAELATTIQSGLDAVNAAIEGTVSAGYTGDVSGRLMSYEEGANPILVWDDGLDDLSAFFTLVVTQQVLTDPAIVAIPDGPEKDAIVAAEIAKGEAQLAPYAKSRPMVTGELVPLTTGALLGVEADGDDEVADTPLGIVVPLGWNLLGGAAEAAGGDPYYLDLVEQGEIETARAAFNAALAGAVSDVNASGGDIILVDIESLFLDAAGLTDGTQGITVQSLDLDPDFGPNGIFSTDGIHPCNRGHGIVANAIINAINDRWGADIPEVDIASLLGPSFQP